MLRHSRTVQRWQIRRAKSKQGGRILCASGIDSLKSDKSVQMFMNERSTLDHAPVSHLEYSVPR